MADQHLLQEETPKVNLMDKNLSDKETLDLFLKTYNVAFNSVHDS